MSREETLQRIKDVEAEVRQSKGTALDEKEKILREARREAFELRESLRAQAEKRQDEILKAGDTVTAREKETLLAKGRQEAEALRAEARSNIDRAVDRLIEKFKGALNA